MPKNNENEYRRTTIIRRIARIIGTISAAFWLFIAFAHGVTPISQMELVNIVMAVFIMGSAIGVFVSWINERIGGVITLLFGIAHSTFALIEAGHNQGLAMLISGGPFILAGLLFLRAHSRSTNVNLNA
jgi:hypothetical protein